MSFFENDFARAFGSRRPRLAAIAAIAAAASIAAATHPAAAGDAPAILTSTVKCATNTGACVAGNNTGKGSGVVGTSQKGNGGTFIATSSSGLVNAVAGIAVGGAGVFGFSSGGDGVDGSGGYIGLSGSSGNYPLTLDNGSSTVFYVTANGDVYYHGSFIHFARVQNGATVNVYSAKTAAPTLEDTGTAQLVSGVAQVRLDPTFAAGIDPRVSYRVFVTPRGDTRGLYVAAAGPVGFTVRETQGGHGTLGFDYRIVATELGHTGQRMAPINTALLPQIRQHSAFPTLVAPASP